MTSATGRESDKFMLRLPEGMRDRLKHEAARNDRSLNAEIVARLTTSFEEQDKVLGLSNQQFEELVKALLRQYYEMNDKIRHPDWER